MESLVVSMAPMAGPPIQWVAGMMEVQTDPMMVINGPNSKSVHDANFSFLYPPRKFVWGRLNI
jgi:hypothetical protein